jgi:hypothetical protein
MSWSSNARRGGRGVGTAARVVSFSAYPATPAGSKNSKSAGSPSQGSPHASPWPTEDLGAQRTDLLRAEIAVIGALLGLSVLAWLFTDLEMVGMDAGPGTDPGAFGFYITTWVVMMAAMMLPSLAPMVGISEKTGARSPGVLSGHAIVRDRLPRRMDGLGGCCLCRPEGRPSVERRRVRLAPRGASSLSHGPVRCCRLRVLSAENEVPSEMPLVVRLPHQLLAGRTWRGVLDGHSPGRVVPGLLLGPNGGALCARRDEPDVDGGAGSADRSGKASAVAPHRGRSRRGFDARTRRRRGGDATSRTRFDRPRRDVLNVIDEHHDALTEVKPNLLRRMVSPAAPVRA